MRRFAEFLDGVGLLACAAIHPSHITAYVATLFQYQQKTVEMTLCHLRGFFRFLYLQGQHPHDLSNAVPRIRCTVQPHIPSVWTREEVERLLAVVDRGNPCGKRDYAMLLLVARLGVRVGDLRDLRLDHLDWEAKRIVLPQAKTGQVVSLPLLEDVGWALIEYLQTGRPPVASPYVFVRHHAPFEPFGPDNNLSHVIAKYMRLAQIPIPAGKKHGLHSLRHTLASALLEQHTPLPTIAEILGHLDARTTSIYLKVDIAQLRQCALDPEEVAHATV